MPSVGGCQAREMSTGVLVLAASDTAIPGFAWCRVVMNTPYWRLRIHASVPSGPWVAGRWPVLTQIVQPASLQGR